jgi:hypothetical protein
MSEGQSFSEVVAVALLEAAISTLFRSSEHPVLKFLWRADQPERAMTLTLEIRVAEELGVFPVWSPDWEVPESPKELLDRVAGEVSDWIAESSFAWGQLREVDAASVPGSWN